MKRLILILLQIVIAILSQVNWKSAWASESRILVDADGYILPVSQAFSHLLKKDPLDESLLQELNKAQVDRMSRSRYDILVESNRQITKIQFVTETDPAFSDIKTGFSVELLTPEHASGQILRIHGLAESQFYFNAFSVTKPGGAISRNARCNMSAKFGNFDPALRSILQTEPFNKLPYRLQNVLELNNFLCITR